MSAAELDAIYLTIALASITTVLLLIVGTPLAWWLSRKRANWPAVVEALVAMPLILPPTVLGFYLLLLLAPDTALGALWQQLTGTQLAFSFSALVIGSVIYSLPFVVQPLQAAFQRVPDDLLKVAATLWGQAMGPVSLGGHAPFTTQFHHRCQPGFCPYRGRIRCGFDDWRQYSRRDPGFVHSAV